MLSLPNDVEAVDVASTPHRLKPLDPKEVACGLPTLRIIQVEKSGPVICRPAGGGDLGLGAPERGVPSML